MKRYGLRRSGSWICAPARHDPKAPFVAGLIECRDPKRAWLTDSLDAAHERQSLLRAVKGWSTEICVMVDS